MPIITAPFVQTQLKLYPHCHSLTCLLAFPQLKSSQFPPCLCFSCRILVYNPLGASVLFVPKFFTSQDLIFGGGRVIIFLVGSLGSIVMGLKSKQEMMKMEEKGGGIVDNVDAMHEIFKHLDAESLAMASCVSRGWHQAAMDDALWELVCTKHWPASGISIGRLRSVVNVLGGFRRLYVKWMHPLCTRHGDFKEDNVVWSEDQVQLSLSLFSVEYYGRLGSGSNFYGSSSGSTSVLPNSHFFCNFHGATAGTLSYIV